MGALAGFPVLDPLVGLGITVAIILVLKDAVRDVWHRLMDAVDPALVGRLERASRLYGVQATHDVRVRWLGHTLEAELSIVVDGALPTRSSHAIAEAVRHALFHAEPRLAAVTVHVDPAPQSGLDDHRLTAHHARRPTRSSRNALATPAG